MEKISKSPRSNFWAEWMERRRRDMAERTARKLASNLMRRLAEDIDRGHIDPVSNKETVFLQWEGRSWQIQANVIIEKIGKSKENGKEGNTLPAPSGEHGV